MILVGTVIGVSQCRGSVLQFHLTNFFHPGMSTADGEHVLLGDNARCFRAQFDAIL